MGVFKKPASNEQIKATLCNLWVFAVLNYLYCDVITHMDSDALKHILAGTVGSIRITQGFLLQASIFMEIPISMVLFSRMLDYRIGRWLNIVAGIIMSAGQIASLFVGTELARYYVFFSAIEISTTVGIVAYAWSHKFSKSSSSSDQVL
jgi:hypothetical protein